MLEEWDINGRQWSADEVETMLGLIYAAWFVGRKGGDWKTPLLVLVQYLAERDVDKYDTE